MSGQVTNVIVFRVLREGGYSQKTSHGDANGVVLFAKACLTHPPFIAFDGGFEKNFCHRGGEIYE